MSTTPIWSLAAPRSELGGATKGTIYLSKIGIGIAGAIAAWLVSLVFNLSPDTVVSTCVAVFVTEKVCYYVNKKTLPTGWDDGLDWICDGMLSLSWFGLWNLVHGNWHFPLTMLVLFLVSYPFSCE